MSLWQLTNQRAMGGLWQLILGLLSLAPPAAAGCERSTSVLLFGDSLTEGLLGNGCFRRAHANPPPTPYRDKRGDVRARPAPSPKTFDKRACFYPYALRLGERYAEENATVAFEFVTSPPAEVPAGSRAAAPCDADHRERVTLVEAGVSGERVDHMVPRLRALLASRCFDAVVVLAGTNNLGGDAAASILDHVAQLRAAVARACPGARVLSVTLPELARDRWPGPAKTRVAVNAKLPGRDRVDLDALTCRTCGRGDRDGLWDEDGIHLARPGYDAFGDAVFAALKRPGDGIGSHRVAQGCPKLWPPASGATTPTPRPTSSSATASSGPGGRSRTRRRRCRPTAPTSATTSSRASCPRRRRRRAASPRSARGSGGGWPNNIM